MNFENNSFQVMKGYWRNPKATEETIRDDWLHSGDIGYYNDEGHFFITGRMKELIKVKGFQARFQTFSLTVTF